MSRLSIATLICVGTALAVASGFSLRATLQAAPQLPRLQVAREQTSSPTSAISAEAAPRETLEGYCVACHNQRLKTAGLMLDKMDVGNVGESAEVWEKVVLKLRGRQMPPAGRPRPDDATYEALVTWLETELDRAAAADPNPGLSTVHRLNRVEYGNAVRDLLGLEVDPERLLPPDDEDEGFNNIANVLTVSPTLVERYLFAARRISQLAIGDPAFAPRFETYVVPERELQDGHTSDGLPFGTRGGLAVRHHFPLDAEYTIRVRLRRTFYHYIRGIGNEPHQLDVRVDGVLMKKFIVGGEYKGEKCPASFCGISGLVNKEWETYATHADDHLEVRIPVKAGTRLVGIAFVRKPASDDGVLQPPVNMSTFGYSTDEMMDGLPAVASVIIGGPYDGNRPTETLSRQKVFVCRPASPDGEEGCAKEIIGTLAKRAYRRPVTARDVEALFSFFEMGRREGGFDMGIQAVLERVLVAPEFLFRIEHDSAGRTAAYRITDLDLASRLSFFLWSSIPDDELLDLAARGQLKETAVLEGQVRRMLADPRSAALVRNFAGQWLELRKIRNAAPDPTVFPEFDENLREAMGRETELFLESLLREDRSVVELLRANYTFLNERLARHYGVPGVYGNHFRRVTWPEDHRRAGILGHGSILTLTSYANRTSPVMRGKWVLENLLGMPPPHPPPNVPALKENNEEGAPSTTVRERMEEHRKNPACAVCHKVMDPMGFSLENFDGIGRWRTTDDTAIPGEAGSPIDASGVLPDGTQFEGSSGLRQVLVRQEEEFVLTVSQKLLMYALGRRVEYYDMPVVRQILREAAASDYRWSAVITGIVKSMPFQMRGRS